MWCGKQSVIAQAGIVMFPATLSISKGEFPGGRLAEISANRPALAVQDHINRTLRSHSGSGPSLEAEGW